MSNQHVLKIHPAPLADLLSGAKTAEVRRNDRTFQVGDTVRLMEVNPETGNWTGAADHVRTISHIQTGYGLPDGMCVLSYAQAGMELVGYANFDQLDNMLDDRAATLHPKKTGFAGTPVYRARAALAIQPAAIKLPPRQEYQRGHAFYFNNLCAISWNQCLDAVQKLNAVRGAEHE